MKKDIHPLIIIGAGLTGLTAAYALGRAGINTILLEARDRLGGRMLTTNTEDGTPIEMGATWLGKKHVHLTRLLAELGLEIEEQYLGEQAVYEPLSTSPPQLVQLPPNPDPSYRIKRGSSQLIETLAGHLGSDQLHLGEAVEAITHTGSCVEVKTNQRVWKASTVVSTLPPNLLVETIQLSPALPEKLVAVAQKTHTWMGESIKIGLSFPKPFWRNGSTSGTVFSNVGPVSELYDHTNSTGEYFALKGFLNSAYHLSSRAERQELVVQQLRKYYGPQIDSFANYEERVWSQEPYTYHPYAEAVLPHQHNGHVIFQDEYWDGHLIIAGSETAPQFPGYMDGAVQSGRIISQRIQTLLDSPPFA